MKKRTFKKTIFVYGSLKKGFANHSLLGKNTIFLDVDTVKGEMYSATGYPRVFPGNDTIHGEIYQIDIPEYNYIEAMEVRAGYEVIYTKTGKGKIVPVFYFSASDPYIERYKHSFKNERDYIPSGMWVEPQWMSREDNHKSY